MRDTLASARTLAGADGATFVLRDGDTCFYAVEDAISPLWAGQRFPLSECISGWAMMHREQAFVADIALDERIPVEAYRPTFVRSLVMTPMADAGALGIYWSDERAEVAPEVLARLRDLADETAQVIARLGLDSAPWAPNFSLRHR